MVLYAGASDKESVYNVWRKKEEKNARCARRHLHRGTSLSSRNHLHQWSLRVHSTDVGVCLAYSDLHARTPLDPGTRECASCAPTPSTAASICWHSLWASTGPRCATSRAPGRLLVRCANTPRSLASPLTSTRLSVRRVDLTHCCMLRWLIVRSIKQKPRPKTRSYRTTLTSRALWQHSSVH